MIRAALTAWLLCAGIAVAQESKQPEKKPERPRLNLRLDNPSSFAREAPPETEEKKELPSLGANARKVESGPSRTLPGSGPYPRGSPQNP